MGRFNDKFMELTFEQLVRNKWVFLEHFESAFRVGGGNRDGKATAKNPFVDILNSNRSSIIMATASQLHPALPTFSWCRYPTECKATYFRT
jgi:hypothetical protein